MNNSSKPNNHLLEGSVIKSILMISIPVIFANLLQSLYQLIDTFWVGRLGAEAVAAVSLSFPILFFLTSLAMGFAMAGSILVAQYNGKGDKKRVSLAAGQTFSLVSVIAIILSIFGFLASRLLLSFLTDNSGVLDMATSYLQISFLAMWSSFIYIIFQSTLRGIGEVKLPMLIVLISVIINFFIDPLFMYGWNFIPAMGVSGVALATLITETISAIIGIVIISTGFFGIQLKFKDLYLKINWVKKLFKIGLPSSIEMSSRSFGMLLMTFIVSAFGTVAVAAFGIGIKLLTFVIIPAMGLSIATSALIGNNLGAKKHARAEAIVKTGMKIGFFTLTFIGILLFVFASNIANFFVPGENEVIAMSSNFIKIMSLTFGFIGIQMVVLGTVKAAGQTTKSMLIAMFHTFSLFTLGFLLSKIFNLQELGIWIAYPIANFLALNLAFYFYIKKDWLKKELI